MSDAIRVLVADDQEIIRTGLSMILNAQPGIEVVGEAGARWFRRHGSNPRRRYHDIRSG